MSIGWPLGVGGVLAAAVALRMMAFLGTAPLATLPDPPRGEDPAGDGPTLLHIFQAEDCFGFRELIREWNELHRKRSLPVLGVALHLPPDPSARAAILRASGAAFPVRDDAGGEVERLALRLGFGRTPLSVLLDRTGRPRLVLPPLAGPDGPRRAVRLVLEVAASLPGGRSAGGGIGRGPP